MHPFPSHFLPSSSPTMSPWLLIPRAKLVCVPKIPRRSRETWLSSSLRNAWRPRITSSIPTSCPCPFSPRTRVTEAPGFWTSLNSYDACAARRGHGSKHHIIPTIGIFIFLPPEIVQQQKSRLTGLCRCDGLREYGQPWYVSDFSSRLFHRNAVSNESEMLPGGVAGSCDLARRVNAPYARISSFCTGQGSNDGSVSPKSRRLSFLANEGADNLSSFIYSSSGCAIWNRVGYIKGEDLAPRKRETVADSGLVRVPISDDVAAGVDSIRKCSECSGIVQLRKVAFLVNETMRSKDFIDPYVGNYS